LDSSLEHEGVASAKRILVHILNGRNPNFMESPALTSMQSPVNTGSGPIACGGETGRTLFFNGVTAIEGSDEPYCFQVE
jgi:hypothetical protein